MKPIVMSVTYYQALFINSTNHQFLYLSEAYTSIQELRKDLSDNLDEIGGRFSESDNDAKYLGGTKYLLGMEFNDHKEQWDFNDDTLMAWIDFALENKAYSGPMLAIVVYEKEVLDCYLPLEVDKDDEYDE